MVFFYSYLSFYEYRCVYIVWFNLGCYYLCGCIFFGLAMGEGELDLGTLLYINLVHFFAVV